MELVFASGNEHKASEIRALFKGHTIIMPKDLGIEFSCDEDGKTFFENSYKKALELYRMCKKPILADDSGLCVKALGGKPGIYSARYGEVNGKPLSASERNDLLVKEMQGIAQRDCAFVCCMVFLFSETRYIAVQEELSGTLIEDARGTHGFGYDPIVFLPHLNKTVAQLSEDEKNELSHRGRAAKKILSLLDNQKGCIK